MTTATKLFLGIAVFLFAVGAVYWFLTYEDAGSVLLVGAALTAAIVAAYAIRHGALSPEEAGPEDRPDADVRDVAGTAIGSFPFSSAWPIVFAVGMLFVGMGLLYALILLPVGVVLATIAVIGLMRESVS